MSLILKERPLFVLGAERSGTTLLMAMLGHHQRIAVPEVVWYYPRFRPYLHTYGDLSIDVNFRTLAEEMIFGLKTPFWGLNVNPTSFLEEIIHRSPERTFAGIYAAMHEYYAEQEGKPRWGEKTPHNLYFVGEILEDFPQAQFIFLTRDGRDASADYLESSFGPTNIYTAAQSWKRAQKAVVSFRTSLKKDQWLDVSYEQLVRKPAATLQIVTDFLDETYDPNMLNFHQGEIAKRRGNTRDHAPLGGPASTQYIGIHKTLLSIRDQQIFNWVAGEELIASGYESELEPLPLSEREIARYIELDGRYRAASLDAPDGHIVYESYNDWIIDQRERRRQVGVWQDQGQTNFPIGNPNEEEIIGQRATRKWKNYFGIKRRYITDKVVL